MPRFSWRTAARIVAGLLAASGAGPASAQDLGPRVDSIFAGWNGVASPGCVVGVGRGASVRYARGYGMASLEHGVPLTPEAVLDVGSAAKQVTAAAVVLLAQRGRLSLDDDVRRYVPELPDYGVPVTIRQMLQHTSGLRDAESLQILRDRFPGAALYTGPEVLHLLARQRALNFAPGTEWLYSNTGYVLAALVVERVSGQSLAAFTAEAFFRPLGMARTRWRERADDVVPGLATAYAEAEGGGYRQSMPLTDVYGPGGLLTTVGDFVRWNDALSRGRIAGGRALVDVLETPGTLASGAGTGYGMGLMLATHRGAREVHHDGGTMGYNSFVARYPAHGLSVAVLCNAAEANPIADGRRVAALLLPSPPAPAAAPRPRVPVARAALEGLAGTYLDTLRSRTLTVTASDTGLAVRGRPFVPVGPTTFRNEAIGEMAFARGAGGAWAMTTTNVAGVRAAWVPAPPAATGPDALRAYEGTYHSEELGVDYAVRLAGDRLELVFDPVRGRLPGAFVFGEPAPAVLEPAYRDGFEVGAFKVRFARDAAGGVVGFRASMERARNVRFTRVPP